MSHAMHRWLAALGLLLLLPTSLAAAQSEADALIDRGVELRRQGDDEGALALFAEAWERGHTPRARAQMALAEQALGQFVEAEAHLEEALAAVNDEWIARRADDLRQALASLRMRLGTLELRGGVPGAEVRIDGRTIGQLPLDGPIRLPAGNYRLDVIASGYYPLARSVEVVPEGTTRENLALTERPRTGSTSAIDGDELARARVVPSEPPRRGRRVLAWTLVGTGGAFLVASGATFALRQDRARDWNAFACIENGGTRASNCSSDRDAAQRAQRLSAASLSLGVTAAATGVVLLLTTPEDERVGAVEIACAPTLIGTWGGACALRF